MRWTERQLAMLREMGVPPFWPTEPVAVAVATPAPAPDAVSVAAQPPRTPPAERPASAPAAPARPSAAAPALPAVSEAILGPRPVGVDTMDWPTLRDTVAGCQACGLCQSRKQTVFGTGHTQARWMLVGEAPGEQEDRQGEPFVGRAGQLLDRMLAAVGLEMIIEDTFQFPPWGAEDPPLVEPGRLDPKHLPAGHKDKPSDR